MKTIFKNKPLIALDLGTTKFCLAMLTLTDAQEPCIKTVSVQASGMRRGMLSSFNEAKQALFKLTDIAEQEFDIDVNEVVVGIAGSHIHGRVIHEHFEKIDQKISYRTIANCQKVTKERHTEPEKEFLHLIPLSYQLDQREWTRSPVGLSANNLNIKYFGIESDKNYLRDVLRLCNECGLKIANLYAEPYASGSVVSTARAKKYGLVTADIGGGTTDGMIYYDGRPVKTFTVNIAGKLMTSDLAFGLGVSYEDAEALKLNYGILSQSHSISLTSKDNQQKIIKPNAIEQILKARIAELASFINKEIAESKNQMKSGLLLTGGGSEVKGIQNYMSKLLGLEVFKEKPAISKELFPISAKPGFDDTSFLSTKYATAVGLLHLYILDKLNSEHTKKNAFMERYFHKLYRWIKELA